MVLDKARVAGVAIAVTVVGWGFSALKRSRQAAQQRAVDLAEEERRARWEAGAPERERQRQEAEERKRQRHEEFLAAAEVKQWRYDVIVGECHLEKHKKRFVTELDAKIFTWKLHERHGKPLQRAYECDGRDAPDGHGCGAWHLTSKTFFS